MRNAIGVIARDSLRWLANPRNGAGRTGRPRSHRRPCIHLRVESISEGYRPLGSSVLYNLLHFPDETGLHVENKTPDRNFFGDPRV